MEKAKVADTCPKQVELVAGQKYAYCTCGLSDSQPFCNGSHKGTGFTPVVFTAEETKTAHFCQCKQTGNEPYCDGTHKTVSHPAPDSPGDCGTDGSKGDCGSDGNSGGGGG